MYTTGYLTRSNIHYSLLIIGVAGFEHEFECIALCEMESWVINFFFLNICKYFHPALPSFTFFILTFELQWKYMRLRSQYPVY